MPPIFQQKDNQTRGDGKPPIKTVKQHFTSRPLRPFPQRQWGTPIKKSDEPCRLWSRNLCTRGDNCRFLHDPEAQKKHFYLLSLFEGPQNKNRDVERKEKEIKEQIEADRLIKLEQDKIKEESIKQDALATVQQLILGCALVTCSAGLNIQEIICGFESCRMRIRQLPRDAKRQEIINLFSQQGIKASHYFLKHIRPFCGNHLEAEVVTTALIGDLMLSALDSLPFRNEILRCEKLSAGEMVHVDISTQAVESITLTISCKTPTSMAIATYASMEQTETAVKEKNATVFEGYKILVEKNSSPPTGPALKHYVPTSVRIRGLPPTIDLERLRKYMSASSVRQLKANTYNFSQFQNDLETHLRYSSRVNMKSISMKPVDSCTNKGRAQFEVLFDTWQDAKDAMEYLSEKRFKPNYPHLFLNIPPRFRYYSSIPIPQYRAQERRWAALLADTKEATKSELLLRFGESRVFMTIRGNDIKAIGSLKVKVENLARGEKLAETYWHPSFCSPSGREFLGNVSTLTDTLLISDWRLNALKIYHASDRRRSKALLLVKDEVERLSSQEWTVLLNHQMVGYLIRTGLQILKEELGEDAPSLDLVSLPRKLIIKAGLPSARQTVSRLLEEAKSNSSEITPSSINTCPICYDKTILPIELGCGHNYCLSCFRHYLISAPDTKTFPLLCMGNGDTCKTPIPIPILRKYLTQLQFDRLVEVAFFTYIERNPNKIRYCPTPDCPQVYMCTGRDAENKFQQCPSCLISICTSCHVEAHGGMSCTEMQLHKDPTEQERRNIAWAEENGVKRCPQCSVWIMKADGCDHMTCLCGAHICWRCMGLFPANEIYNHINTTHPYI